MRVLLKIFVLFKPKRHYTCSNKLIDEITHPYDACLKGTTFIYF